MNDLYKIIIFLLILCFQTFAAEIYPFNDNSKRQQFQTLTHQFRCLVCQNQDLASSSAGLADDLRQQIYQLIQQGQTNLEIKQYMEARYGQFILFSPPWRWQTSLLWLAPAVFFLVAVIVMICVVKRRALNNFNS